MLRAVKVELEDDSVGSLELLATVATQERALRVGRGAVADHHRVAGALKERGVERFGLARCHVEENNPFVRLFHGDTSFVRLRDDRRTAVPPRIGTIGPFCLSRSAQSGRPFRTEPAAQARLGSRPGQVVPGTSGPSG